MRQHSEGELLAMPITVRYVPSVCHTAQRLEFSGPQVADSNSTTYLAELKKLTPH
jgi:hypothetical protein